MSTLRVTNAWPISGISQSLMRGMAKVWNQFADAGTVASNAGLNMSSMTDGGTGDYTTTFTSAMISNAAQAWKHSVRTDGGATISCLFNQTSYSTTTHRQTTFNDAGTTGNATIGSLVVIGTLA